MKKIVFMIGALLTASLLIATSVMPVMAQQPDPASDCADGICPESAAGDPQRVQVGGEAVPENEAGVRTEGLGGAVIYTINGGYTAAGVGLRNRGAGKIKIDQIPAGAHVYKAFLYWNIVDETRQSRHKLLFMNGKLVTGSFIGAAHSPCWMAMYGSAYSYRADVTSLVTGNGSYKLTGVASGITTGEDPWTVAPILPLAEGASLVVIYTKSSYPVTRVYLWEGAEYSGSSVSPYIVVGPIPALSDPVGLVRTTAIVADGQSDATGPTLSVEGNPVSGSNFAGSDPKKGGGIYTHGNLWDTATFSVGDMLYPGLSQIEIGIIGSNDCVVWVAQVVSISDGTLDTDGDALLDGWEANGWQGVDLPTMGASPFHKDIFVENDWMPGHKPSDAVLETIRQSFAAAPVINPDGISGINLHSDIGQGGVFNGGNEVAYRENWDASGCESADIWAIFDEYKLKNFAPSRGDIFHYMIWSHNQCAGNSSSGLARGIPSSDFVVTLGLWPGYGTDAERQGTYMHELGHNLGLTHGGATDNHVNYKPNHLSIMNYTFQVVGVWRDGARRWDYQRVAVNSLNEKALNETLGLRNGVIVLTNYGTTYTCPNGSWQTDKTAATIDWNCNGSASDTSVSVSINKDATKETLGATQNQWKKIIYNGGSIGLSGPVGMLSAESVFEIFPCMTYEDAH